MPRDKRDIESSLKTKGFVQDDNDHHFFIYWTIDGKKTRARTKTSHTSKIKAIDDSLLALMGKQCKLNKAQFLSLVDCPMTREQFETVLAGLGELELPNQPPSSG